MLTRKKYRIGLLLACAPFIASAQGNQTESIKAFLAAAPVLQHPRCINCHPKGDSPLQTDASRAHIFNVKRGPKDRGVGGYTCKSCHPSVNVADTPGAVNWHLAPRAMAWSQSSNAEICAALTDKARNGNRALSEIVAHVGHDALVLWAWQPGNKRTTPPLSHLEFVNLMRRWAATGGFCPK